MGETNYRDIKKMNQSLLKTILQGPQKFLRTQDAYIKSEENKANGIIEQIAPHFLLGSMLDFMLTEDGDFDDVYYVMNTSKLPSDTIQAMVNDVFNNYPVHSNMTLADYSVELEKVVTLFNYQANWKMETRVNKVISEGSLYFEILKDSSDKIIVSADDYSKAVLMKAALLADPYTSKYLKKTKTMEIIKKPIFEFSFKGIDFKGEGDLIAVDHKTKEIHPLDIKSMAGDALSFESNFWSYRYDFQGEFYKRGIAHHPVLKKLIEDGYKVVDFKFLVVGNNEHTMTPFVYTYSNQVAFCAINGGSRNGKKYEGIVQAINRLKWHSDNNKWDYPMEYYLNNGITKIELD